MADGEDEGFPSISAPVDFGWEKPVSSRKRKEESKRKVKPGSFGAVTRTPPPFPASPPTPCGPPGGGTKCRQKSILVYIGVRVGFGCSKEFRCSV